MISCTCSYAQEDVTVTISMNKWKAMEESVKHLNDSITSLNKIIVSKGRQLPWQHYRKQVSQELSENNC